MANVTAAEVRAAGGWSSTEISDADLATIAFIPAGDGWLGRILTRNGYDEIDDLDTNVQALARGAECYYIAYLVASRPAKEDFQAGPFRSYDVKNDQRVKAAEHYMKTAKEMLSQAGLKYEKWDFSYAGGDDYHPDGDDDTNIDFGFTGSDDEFYLIGGDANK